MIERMNNRIERLIDEWSELQNGVPDGLFRCPECKRTVSSEPIQVSEHPDAPVCCWDCLGDSTKAALERAFEPLSFDAWEILQ